MRDWVRAARREGFLDDAERECGQLGMGLPVRRLVAPSRCRQHSENQTAMSPFIGGARAPSQVCLSKLESPQSLAWRTR